MTQPTREPGDAEHRESRNLVVASLVGAGLVFAACFWPLVQRRFFLYADLGNASLAFRMFYADRLGAGESPLWLPNIFCGYYLHGDGQVGMYHPLHWLQYRLLPFEVAFALECLLSYPMALAGMFLFLRSLHVPRAAALVGGIAFGFSSYLLVRYTHVNVVAVLAHVPWLLWLATHSARGLSVRRRRGAWVGIALMTASQVLLGYPGAVVFSIGALGLYAILLGTETRSIRPLVSFAAASSLGILIGAVQFLPTLDLFAESLRVDTSWAERTAQSLHPWNLLQLIAPYLYGQRVYQVGIPNPIEQSFYLGSAPPIAAIWLLVRGRRLAGSNPDRRRLLIGLGSMCLVCLLLALGRYTGLYELFAALPFLGQLRVPARFTFFLHIAAAIVLALAFSDVLRTGNSGGEGGGRAGRWICAAPVASGVVALLALIFSKLPTAPGGWGRSIAAVDLVLLGPALSLFCAALWSAAARGARMATACLVLFVAADPAAYGAALWWSVPPQTLDDYVAETPQVPDPEAGRVATGFSLVVMLNEKGDVIFPASTRYTLRGARLVGGYSGLMPDRALHPAAPRTLEVAGTAYVLQRGRFVARKQVLPRFRLVSEASIIYDLSAQMQRLDPARTALVSRPIDLEPGPPGSVRVTRDKPGDIRVSVDAPTRQLLVVSESFHSGWQLEIDGDAAPVLRVYGDFMGAVVAPGAHEIELRFRPPSFSNGLALSGVGLLVLVAAGAFAWRASDDALRGSSTPPLRPS